MAITQVQEQGATETSNSTTLATTISSTSGNLLVACVFCVGNSAPTDAAISDTAGNTWTQIGASVGSPTTQGTMFYSTQNVGAVTSVTVTVGTSTTIAMAVMEYTSQAASPFDVQASTSGGSTAPASGSTATTAQAAEIAIGFIGWKAINGGDSAWTSGYTLNTLRTSNATDLSNVRTAYKVLTATGAQSISNTISSSQRWAAFDATFMAAAIVPRPVVVNVVRQAVNRAATY